MPLFDLKQLVYESDVRKRLLGFITEEIIHSKIRLTQLLQNNLSDVELNAIEDFQNKLVRADMFLSLVRDEVVVFDKLLVREIFEDGLLNKEVNLQRKRLRRVMKNLEQQFAQLKKDFNNFLAEND